VEKEESSMRKPKLRQQNELSHRRRELLKFSASLFTVGVISGGLGIGSAYLLTGGTRLKNAPKSSKIIK
jgi:hypothetical protein